MKNFKKSVSIILSAATIVGLMSGCSGNKAATGTSSTPAPASTAASSDKTKISVWTANRSDADYAQAQVKNYNDTNKDGVQIEYSIYSDNYQQTLELSYASGNAPDVFFDTGDFFTKYVKQGYFLPIDKYMTDDYKKRFGDGGFIDGINVIDGKTYTLGAIGTTPRLIYNKGVFQKAGISAPPKSMKEFVDDTKQITNKLKGDGVYGFAANLKSPNSAIQRTIVQILERSGSPIKEGFDFSKGQYDFTAYKPILEAWKDIFSSGAAFPGCESLDIDPLRSQFANGKIGMYISWSHAEPAVYANQFQTKEDWGVAQIPTIDGTVKGSQDINLADKWLYINGKTKNPDKAWKAMEMFYSDSFLSGYYEKGLSVVTVPSVLKVAKAPETIQKNPELAFTNTDQTWPNLPTSVSPEGQNYYSVFASIMFGAEKNTDSALADVTKRYNAAYDKAVADGKTSKIKYDGFDPANPGKSLTK